MEHTTTWIRQVVVAVARVCLALVGLGGLGCVGLGLMFLTAEPSMRSDLLFDTQAQFGWLASGAGLVLVAASYLGSRLVGRR